MKKTKILCSLTDEQLLKIYTASNEYRTDKRILIMTVVALVSPLIYPQFISIPVNRSIIYLSIIVFLVTILVRKQINNSALNYISILIYGILFLMITSQSNVSLGFFKSTLALIIYFFGALFLKKKSFIAILKQKIMYTEKAFSTSEKVTLITSAGLLPLFITVSLENSLVLVISFTLSMTAVSNIFNGYYEKECQEEMNSRGMNFE